MLVYGKAIKGVMIFIAQIPGLLCRETWDFFKQDPKLFTPLIALVSHEQIHPCYDSVDSGGVATEKDLAPGRLQARCCSFNAITGRTSLVTSWKLVQ